MEKPTFERMISMNEWNLCIIEFWWYSEPIQKTEKSFYTTICTFYSKIIQAWNKPLAIQYFRTSDYKMYRTFLIHKLTISITGQRISGYIEIYWSCKISDGFLQFAVLSNFWLLISGNKFWLILITQKICD